METPASLLAPLTIGALTFRNRIVMPPHGTLHSVDGFVSERNVAYFEECAEGRAGGSVVHRIGDCSAPRLLDNAIWDGTANGTL